MIRIVALVFALVLAGSFPKAAYPACGHDELLILGTAEEVDETCRATEEVLIYFEQIGFTPKLRLTVSFHDRVYVDIYYIGAQDPNGQVQVSGFFDYERKEVKVTSGTLRGQESHGVSNGGNRSPIRSFSTNSCTRPSPLSSATDSRRWIRHGTSSSPTQSSST